MLSCKDVGSCIVPLAAGSLGLRRDPGIASKPGALRRNPGPSAENPGLASKTGAASKTRGLRRKPGACVENPGPSAEDPGLASKTRAQPYACLRRSRRTHACGALGRRTHAQRPPPAGGSRFCELPHAFHAETRFGGAASAVCEVAHRVGEPHGSGRCIPPTGTCSAAQSDVSHTRCARMHAIRCPRGQMCIHRARLRH